MHEDRDGHIHVSQEEASGGSKEGVVRWVLVLGLLLAIGLLSVTWITGALTQGDVESQGDVGGQISAVEDDSGDSTDSIVSENVDSSDDAAGEAEPVAPAAN
jgi:hypothetical protein